ncbi:MAG: hypothetical protein ACRD68_02890 [Pyrinomonadaceae bacterium]
MKRPIRFATVLAVSLALVPFLPFYVERTMARSSVAGHAGDVVEWGWRLRTLSSYWSDYSYFRPEQRPALWLGVNFVLGLAYALIIALCIDRFLARRKRHEGRGH